MKRIFKLLLILKKLAFELLVFILLKCLYFDQPNTLIDR